MKLAEMVGKGNYFLHSSSNTFSTTIMTWKGVARLITQWYEIDTASRWIQRLGNAGENRQTNTHELIWKVRSDFVNKWVQHGGVFQRHICSSASWVHTFKLLIDGKEQFPRYHFLKCFLIKTHLTSQSSTPI